MASTQSFVAATSKDEAIIFSECIVWPTFDMKGAICAEPKGSFRQLTMMGLVKNAGRIMILVLIVFPMSTYM